MPMACGVLRPAVMMPEEADVWPAERLRIVLLHELAHVKRHDCLTHLVAQMACALHWFNPLAWIAARNVRTERERACDDLVLAAGTRGSGIRGSAAGNRSRDARRPLPAVLAGANSGHGAPITTRGTADGDSRSARATCRADEAACGCRNGRVLRRRGAARRRSALDVEPVRNAGGYGHRSASARQLPQPTPAPEPAPAPPSHRATFASRDRHRRRRRSAPADAKSEEHIAEKAAAATSNVEAVIGSVLGSHAARQTAQSDTTSRSARPSRSKSARPSGRTRP